MVLLATTFSITSWAMGDAKRASSDASTAKSSINHYWYDGKRKRTITQDTRVVAEIIAPGASSVMKANFASAITVGKQTSATVRLWDVSAAGGAVKTMSTLNTTMNSSVSPVFTNGQAGGQRMALPGGILVTFKADWDKKKVEQWTSKNKITIKQKLNVGNMYVLNSAPGIASLDLANSIYESGSVESASPNWWHDLRPF